MKYKEYIILLEHDESGSVYRSQINFDEAISIYIEQCNKNHGVNLYRGVRGNSYGEYNVIEGEKGGRKSVNTTNHYTVIFDELIAEKSSDYPLRSKSIICSTDTSTAKSYGHLYNVIPYNDVKIGLVPEDDIWHIDIKEYDGVKLRLTGINSLFDACGIKATNIKDIAKQVEKLSDDDFEKLAKVFKTRDNIEKQIRDLYNMDRLGFKFMSADKLDDKQNPDNEVWVGGKCLMIDSKVFHKFKNITSKNYKLVNGRGEKYKGEMEYADVYVESKDGDLNSAEEILNLDKLNIVELKYEYDNEKLLPIDFFTYLSKYMPNDKKDVLIDMIDEYKDETDKFTVDVLLDAFSMEMEHNMNYFIVDGFKIKNGYDVLYIMKKGIVSK